MCAAIVDKAWTIDFGETGSFPFAHEMGLQISSSKITEIFTIQ